ncbi:unnamed protein product [Linum tenue]|uniref:Aminotransferase-like plant mobile domain-containing protein n=1 Tax=Linum tenue TaxID=586396 RepID=A0AAV0LI04_9ROSI|nr:unnamed protein product [Linum tenue]
MPLGEVTITLEDVATLSGLPIDGEAVIVDVPDREWLATCIRLLGHAPNDLNGGVVKITWLREHFNNLPLNASSEITEQFARAYALSLMGCMMFPDRTEATVHLQYLLLLDNWRSTRGYAWGATVLAYLYREMGRLVLHMTQSSSTGGDLGGWLALLQLWAWERLPLITPRHSVTDEPITEDAYPRGARWLPAMTRQHGDQLFSYKLFFDELSTIVVSNNISYKNSS